MKKLFLVAASIFSLAVATLPADARGFGHGGFRHGGGWGPGIGFGIAAGALAAGAYGPYGYGYSPYAYYGSPYGYGRPYWRRGYYRHYW